MNLVQQKINRGILSASGVRKVSVAKIDPWHSYCYLSNLRCFQKSSVGTLNSPPVQKIPGNDSQADDTTISNSFSSWVALLDQTSRHSTDTNSFQSASESRSVASDSWSDHPRSAWLHHLGIISCVCHAAPNRLSEKCTQKPHITHTHTYTHTHTHTHHTTVLAAHVAFPQSLSKHVKKKKKGRNTCRLRVPERTPFFYEAL